MFISKYMIISQVFRLFSLMNLHIHHAFADLSGSKMTEKRESMISNRERAVWACQVINIIKDAQLDNKRDIYQPSLRDQILDLDIKGFTSSQQSRDSIINLFRKGIVLNLTVFNQTQIKSSPQIQSITLGNRLSSSEFGQRFIFCPNMLVTRPMFQHLYSFEHKMVTLGGYGISKTTSLVLFHQLSSTINMYAYSAFSDPEEQPYLKELIAKNLLFKVPKLFYWSLASTEVTEVPTESTLKNILLQQATELPIDEKNQLQLPQFQSLKTFSMELQRLYKAKNIVMKMAFDQLNLAVSLMRKWNLSDKLSQLVRQYYYSTDKKTLAKDFQKRKQLAQKIQISQDYYSSDYFDNCMIYEGVTTSIRKNFFRIPSQAFLKLMNSFGQVGIYLLYNGFMKLEEYLLLNNHNFNKVTLALLGLGQLHQKKISFNDGLSEQWGQNDFKHYFWFEIQKRLIIIKGFAQQRLQKLKKLFYDKLKDQKIHKYYSFLNIGQSFQDKQSLFNFFANTQHFSDEIMNARFGQLIKNLNIFSLNTVWKKINLFYKKLEIYDKQIYDQFRIIFQKVAQKQIKQGNGKYYTQKKLSMLTFVRCLNEFDREFYPFQINSEGSAVLLQWTPKEYLKINQLQKFRDKCYFIKSYKEIISIYLQQQKENGYAFKNILLKILQTPETIIRMSYHLSQYQILSRIFKISYSTNFLRFHGNQQNTQNMDNIWINFSKMLTLAKANPNKQIFGLPYEVKQLLNHQQNEQEYCKFYPNNPTTNFAIVSYKTYNQQKNNYFQIASFQTTFTDQQNDLYKKVEKAKILFQSLLQSEFSKVKLEEQENKEYFKGDQQYKNTMNTSIYLIHYIICRENLAQKRSKIQINSKLAVNFISLKSIDLLSCPITKLNVFQSLINPL